jgi:hypothetical protein
MDAATDACTGPGPRTHPASAWVQGRHFATGQMPATTAAATEIRCIHPPAAPLFTACRAAHPGLDRQHARHFVPSGRSGLAAQEQPPALLARRHALELGAPAARDLLIALRPKVRDEGLAACGRRGAAAPPAQRRTLPAPSAAAVPSARRCSPQQAASRAGPGATRRHCAGQGRAATTEQWEQPGTGRLTLLGCRQLELEARLELPGAVLGLHVDKARSLRVETGGEGGEGGGSGSRSAAPAGGARRPGWAAVEVWCHVPPSPGGCCASCAAPQPVQRAPRSAPAASCRTPARPAGRSRAARCRRQTPRWAGPPPCSSQ